MKEVFEYIQKHKKLIITLVCVVIFAIIAKNLFDNFALVNIKVNEQGSSAAAQNVKIYASTSAENVELGGSGLKIIPRTTKSLVATKDERASTQVKIKIPWHGFLEQTITLSPSKNADKMAYLNTSSDGCATYSVRLQTLLSYDCIKPLSLVRYDTTSKIWGIRKVSNLTFRNKLVAPYMGGVIGIRGGMHMTGLPIEVVKDDGTATQYELPKGMTLEDAGQARLFTNEFNTADNRFIIVDYAGNIHLATPSAKNKSITYKTIPSPEGYTTTYQQTLCRILGDFVYCYRGHSIRGDTPPSSVKLPSETILTASFTNDTVTTTNIDTPGEYSDFYVTLDGDLYGKNFKKLFYLAQSGDTYKPRELAQNVDTAAGGEGLFYIQRNAIYHVTKDSDATMRFYSHNIVPKSLYISEGSTFILANIKDGGDNLHAYKINDQDYTGGERVIDILPAGSGKLPAVTHQDLVGDRVQFTLAIPLNKTTRRDIDKAELETRKQKVLDTLRSRGLDLTKLDITFTY